MRLREERRDGRLVVLCEEAEWLAENRAWLEQEHAGEWVAVEGSRPLAIAPDLEEVMAEAAAGGSTGRSWPASRKGRIRMPSW